MFEMTVFDLAVVYETLDSIIEFDGSVADDWVHTALGAALDLRIMREKIQGMMRSIPTMEFSYFDLMCFYGALQFVTDLVDNEELELMTYSSSDRDDLSKRIGDFLKSKKIGSAL